MTLVGELETSAVFPAAKNGKAQGSLLTGPLPSAAEAAAATGFACPSGQVLEFDRVDLLRPGALGRRRRGRSAHDDPRVGVRARRSTSRRRASAALVLRAPVLHSKDVLPRVRPRRSRRREVLPGVRHAHRGGGRGRPRRCRSRRGGSSPSSSSTSPARPRSASGSTRRRSGGSSHATSARSATIVARHGGTLEKFAGRRARGRLRPAGPARGRRAACGPRGGRGARRRSPSSTTSSCATTASV